LHGDDLDDLMWLRREMSEDLLDVYDGWAPGRLEHRAGRLQALLSRFSLPREESGERAVAPSAT
jgi:hypothetical protein